MLVVSPEAFERGQTKARLGVLDAEMKAVLSNRYVKDIDKWHMYKRVLDKYHDALDEIKAPVRIPIVRVEKHPPPPFTSPASSNINLKKSLAKLKRQNAELDKTWERVLERIKPIEKSTPDVKRPPRKRRRTSEKEATLPRRGERQRRTKIPWSPYQ